MCDPHIYDIISQIDDNGIAQNSFFIKEVLGQIDDEKIAQIDEKNELLRFSALLVQVAVCGRDSTDSDRNPLEQYYNRCLNRCSTNDAIEQLALLGEAIAVLSNVIAEHGSNSLVGCRLSLPLGGDYQQSLFVKVSIGMASLDHLHALQRFWANVFRNFVESSSSSPLRCIHAVSILSSVLGNININLSASTFSAMCRLLYTLQDRNFLPMWVKVAAVKGSLQWISMLLGKLCTSMAVDSDTVESMSFQHVEQLTAAGRAFATLLDSFVLLNNGATDDQASVTLNKDMALEIKSILNENIVKNYGVLTLSGHIITNTSNSSSSSSSNNSSSSSSSSGSSSELRTERYPQHSQENVLRGKVVRFLSAQLLSCLTHSIAGSGRVSCASESGAIASLEHSSLIPNNRLLSLCCMDALTVHNACQCNLQSIFEDVMAPIRQRLRQQRLDQHHHRSSSPNHLPATISTTGIIDLSVDEPFVTVATAAEQFNSRNRRRPFAHSSLAAGLEEGDGHRQIKSFADLGKLLLSFESGLLKDLAVAAMTSTTAAQQHHSSTLDHSLAVIEGLLRCSDSPLSHVAGAHSKHCLDDILLTSFCRIVAVHADMVTLWAGGCVQRSQSSALSRLPESMDTVLHLLVDRVAHRFHKLSNQMHVSTSTDKDISETSSRLLHLNDDHLLLVAEFENPSLDQIGRWVARGDVESMFALLLTRCCALRPRVLLSSSSSSSSSSTENGPPAAKRQKASETEAMDISEASSNSSVLDGSLSRGFDHQMQMRIALARIARLRVKLRQLSHSANTSDKASNRPRTSGKDSQEQENHRNLQLMTQECADCLVVFTNLLNEYADDHKEIQSAHESDGCLRSVLLICIAEVAGVLIYYMHCCV